MPVDGAVLWRRSVSTDLAVFWRSLGTIPLLSFEINLKGRNAFDKYNNCKDVLNDVI